MIQNFVFDMGGVLIWDRMPELVGGKRLPQEDSQMLYDVVFASPEWKDGWDGGTMTTDEVLEAVFPRLPERLHNSARALMEEWLMNAEWVPGTEDTIRRLKGEGYGIYLLSNTADTFYKYRHRLPAIDCFDGEMISADVHLLKPDRAIYDALTSRFNLKPEECFFFDDRPENIQGAIDAGWQGAVFSGNWEEALPREAAIH